MRVIERVGVVGCGLMGSGISEVCARAGLPVMVREVDAGAVEAGQRRVTTSLDRGVRSGKLTEEERDILRRGRNAKPGSVPRRAAPADYRTSTGLEALVGYWYLTGQSERLHQMMLAILHRMEEGERA